MKRFIVLIAAVFAATAVFAQTESERYEQRYDMLVARLGADGIGIETVLNNWEKVDSTNAKMLMGRFTYLYKKAQTPQVVSRPEKRYLGMDPVLEMKDSLDKSVYYFQDYVFDDDLYGQAVKAADKLISLYPDRLDYRFLKANAYIAYEKESPDMALAYLQDLIRENSARKTAWQYDGREAEKDFFEDAMQEYCYSFYSIGSPASYEAFRILSEQLLGIYPSNMGFMNNIGSYYLVRKEYKTALKYYDKVLKKVPGDNLAMQNGLLAARKLKNVKLEKKYLEMILKHGSEKDRMLAKGRLDALNKR